MSHGEAEGVTGGERAPFPGRWVSVWWGPLARLAEQVHRLSLRIGPARGAGVYLGPRPEASGFQNKCRWPGTV